MEKEGAVVASLVLLVCAFSFFVVAENSEGTLSESRMFGRWLNHTGWDSVDYSTIWGLNNVTYDMGSGTPEGLVSVAEGYMYVGSNSGFYQFNATNISQLIANQSLGVVRSGATIVNGSVYWGNTGGRFYQFNATNISQIISNTSGLSNIWSSAAVAGGNVYFGSIDNYIYQYNASNVSQQIANYSTGDDVFSSPAVANGFVYVGSYDNKIYQLNASNVSQWIASYTTSGDVFSSPAVYNGYVYVASYDNVLYQLNASNVSQLFASYNTSGQVHNSPAISGGYVYISSRNGMANQLNASNVSQWIASYNLTGDIISSPLIANGFFYGGSASGMYQLNASNISIAFSNYTTPSIVGSTPAYAKGYLYFTAYNDMAYQLLASNLSDQVAPRVTIVSPTANTYSTPDIAVNISLNEAGSCNYTISGLTYGLTANESSTGFNGTRTSLSDTNYQLTAYCLDVTGNGNSTVSVNFTVDAVSDASTGSSSSGGGGGSFAPKTYTLTESDLVQGYVRELGTGETYRFGVDEVNHTMTLNSFNLTRATITIRSTPTTLSLVQGETLDHDIDGDGTNDLAFTYQGIRLGKALLHIKLSSLNMPSHGPSSVNETKEANESLREPEQVTSDTGILKEEHTSFQWAMVIIILGVCGAVVYSILSRKQKR